MEIADVKKRVVETIERAKRGAAERRARSTEATKAFESLLESTAVPLFRQVANVLKAHNHPFTVFTPGGSVRLMSERSADNYVELALDTSGDAPAMTLRTRQS